MKQGMQPKMDVFPSKDQEKCQIKTKILSNVNIYDDEVRKRAMRSVSLQLTLLQSFRRSVPEVLDVKTAAPGFWVTAHSERPHTQESIVQGDCTLEEIT